MSAAAWWLLFAGPNEVANNYFDGIISARFRVYSELALSCARAVADDCRRGVIVLMMFAWFGQVATESEAGKYDAQVDTSLSNGNGLVHIL
jgi:hypothetical protein